MILILALDKGSIHIICRKAQNLRLTLWVLGLFVLLASCNSKKYLKEDQSFLEANKITIKSKSKIDDKSELKETLATLYRQDQTKYVLPGIPRHVLYYQYQESLLKKPGRKKWEDERLIKNRPSIHDSTQAELTTEVFEKYLNLKGYRYAQASFKAKTEDKKTTVFYRVDPGPRTYVDSFVIVATDTALIRIVESEKDNTFFKPGSPLDIEIYNKERARLINLFQNEGYATFDETFIPSLEVDTNAVRVKATMRILNETDSTFHKKYYIGNVTIFPDVVQDYRVSDSTLLRDTIIRNVKYITPGKELTLKPEAIERNLFIREGDLYKRENLLQTSRNFNRIELVRFAQPYAEFDTISSDTPLVHYTFYLTRKPKIPLGASVELTYSNIATAQKTLLGTAVSANYRDLNTFKGAEVLNLVYETGVEFDFNAKKRNPDLSIINSINITTGASLSLPRFIDPLRLYHMIGHTGSEDKEPIIGGRLRKWLLYDATSRLNLGYNFVDIQNLYQYNSINIGLNYDMKPGPRHALTIERAGFDLFTPEADSTFQVDVLDQSKFQQESFSKQLYTGFIFKRYFYDYNQGKKGKGSHFRLLHNVELSGLEVYYLNALTNAITGNKGGYYLGKNDGLPGDTVTFSHFAKAEVDLRYFYNVNSQTQLALRLNTGVGSPFGGYTNQVPFPKQFWVGGAQSLRAWQVREVGPGAYIDPNYFPQIRKDSITAFYQTGDFKLDMTAELRFHMFWYFDGALFMDAANVWTLKNDPSRPGTQLKKDFLRQLAVGYGYGIRMDLDYFIIRLDLGYKLFNPYPIEDAQGNFSRFLKDDVRKFPGGAQLQLAVGLNFD